MIVEMAKIRIVGPRLLLPEVVALLQVEGDVHIESRPQDLPAVQSEIPVLRRHTLTGDAQRIREILESALDKIRKLLLILPPVPVASPQEAGIDYSLHVSAGDEDSLRSFLERLDSVAESVETLVRRRKVLEDESSLFSRYEKVLKVLSPLLAVVRESGGLACRGLLLHGRERDAAPLLEQALSRLTDDRYEIIYREVDRDTLAGLLVFPAEKMRETEALLWERNIGELRLPSVVADKPVGEALDIILRSQEEIPRKVRELDEELSALSARWRRALAQTRLRLENRIGQIVASDSFFETHLTFLLYGWIPRAKFSRLERTLAASYGDTVVVERLPIGKSEEESVPVSIINSPLVRPFEIFTSILPLPRYRSVDPTPCVALFFPLFYGIIIGDIGYGLLLLFAARWAARRYRSNPFVSDAATVFSWAALSAALWGIAYGELFGGLGERLGLRPLFLHRMKDFNETMLFALAIGVAHLILGIAIGIRNSWKRGDRRETVARTAGLAIVVAFLAALSTLTGKVPGAFLYIGLAGIAAGLPVLILAAGPAAAMKLHNLVNLFSYLRIMGVGIASVALAYTANRIVFMVPWLPLGILAGVTLHAVNLAFCTLSPTIQSLRLNYVEFFENFFQGGGRTYKPFKITA